MLSRRTWQDTNRSCSVVGDGWISVRQRSTNWWSASSPPFAGVDCRDASKGCHGGDDEEREDILAKTRRTDPGRRDGRDGDGDVFGDRLTKRVRDRARRYEGARLRVDMIHLASRHGRTAISEIPRERVRKRAARPRTCERDVQRRLARRGRDAQRCDKRLGLGGKARSDRQRRIYPQGHEAPGP